MKEGEPASIHIFDPQFAYGCATVPPFVLPNEEVKVNIKVLAMEKSVRLVVSVSNVASLDGMGMDGLFNWPCKQVVSSYVEYFGPNSF